MREPTISGEHDLERILRLTEHFGIRSSVCINKHDLNPEATSRIEELCRSHGATVAARLPFEPGVVEAMVRGVPVVELDLPISSFIRELWISIEGQLLAADLM
ncbi:MAG: hypothetical protein QUS08_02170 [Methanothrix sp.]|nr:hypothetical protein [Methanothrix sp.]